jgi:hypothetical protein
VCWGVTAGKDKIYIGGINKVIILNTEGSFVREITTNGGFTYNLLYNERNDQLLLRVHGTTVILQGSLVNDISSSYVL